jgi:hypothetical protein
MSQFLRDLDEIAGQGNDPDMARVLFERRMIGVGAGFGESR